MKDPTLYSRSITSCVPAGFASLPSSFDPITLLNLSNYTSGLPADANTPPDDAPASPPVPYAAPSMYGYLHDGWVPVVGTGTTFTYSSLAPSLLAQALPMAIGSDLSFGELLAEEITGPLLMTRFVGT